MGSRGLEVSDVICEGGALPGKYTVWEHSSRLPGAPQPHLSSLPALPSGVLFPSCCSPPASVPKERLQLGHSRPPPIPLASRQAGPGSVLPSDKPRQKAACWPMV